MNFHRELSATAILLAGLTLIIIAVTLASSAVKLKFPKDTQADTTITNLSTRTQTPNQQTPQRISLPKPQQ